MPLKPHPTDPDKLVLVSKTYKLPKPWVGLTDEEISEVMEMGYGARASIEIALEKVKEKNT